MTEPTSGDIGRVLALCGGVGGAKLALGLDRVLPPGRRVELDWDAWERLPVFDWLARHVEEEELRRVFNLGIGWCAVVACAQPGETQIGVVR